MNGNFFIFKGTFSYIINSCAYKKTTLPSGLVVKTKHN
jgi:hypothetical protein